MVCFPPLHLQSHEGLPSQILERILLNAVHEEVLPALHETGAPRAPDPSTRHVDASSLTLSSSEILWLETRDILAGGDVA
jgi:hypothetical protein